MKKVSIYLLFFTLLLACTNESNSNPMVEEELVVEEVQEITMQEVVNEVLSVAAFKEKLASTENAQLIDIRTPAEIVENGAMDGAINIDFYELNFKAEIMNLNKDAAVMLYCRSGGRSAQAAALLKELGFKEVYDLEGGYTAWLESANK